MEQIDGNIREFAGYRLDPERRVLWRGFEPVALQPIEIRLLIALTDRPGEMVTKDELLEKVWSGSHVLEANLARHIYRLRKTFASHGCQEDLIQTVPCRGYRFVADRLTSEDVRAEAEAAVAAGTGRIGKTGLPNFSRLRTAIAVSLLAAAIVGIVFVTRSIIAVTASEPPPIRTVAILPPVSLSGNEGDHAVSLGFADAMITGVGRLPNVRVLSPQAISKFSDGARDMTAIAKNLGADAVIDGTMQRAGDRIRVTIRIIRSADSQQIWSGSFEESESNIFRLQDMLASGASASLAPGSPKIETAIPTASIEAYNLYLQGQYLFRRRESGKAGTFFERAVAIDPRFAEAWASLGAVSAMNGEPDKARAAAVRALELDPDLALAHAVSGFLKIFVDWDMNGARVSLDRALEIDRNSLEALHWLGTWETIAGDTEEAKRWLERALQLDPASANLIEDLGYVQYRASEFDDAERSFTRAHELDSARGTARLVWLYELTGSDAGALRMARASYCTEFTEAEIRQACGEPNETAGAKQMSGLRRALLQISVRYARSGHPNRGAYWFGAATWQIRNGDREAALDSLERAIAEKRGFGSLNFSLPFVAHDPLWEPLRNEPRFQSLKFVAAFR